MVAGLTKGVADAARTATSEVGKYIAAASVVVPRADDLLFSVVAILAVFVFKVFVLPVALGMVIPGS